jgi:DNA-binding NarL/FixJ family response regulator
VAPIRCAQLEGAASLSGTEGDVLRAYGEGLSRLEIATRLKRSPRAVSNCLTVAKEKMGARSLAQAAVMLSRSCEVVI